MKAAVLLFHDIFEGSSSVSGFEGRIAERYKLPVSDFLKILERLKLEHALPPLRLTADTLEDLRKLNKNYVLPWMLTFDDGGASALKIAEILENFGWYGHFFVTAERIGSKGFLSASQLCELSARGHVIGTHSFSHPSNFAALPQQKQRQEWSRSKAVLEDILGSAVELASVPGGMFDARVAKIASDAGIRVLFTSEPTLNLYKIDQCWVVGRMVIKQTTNPDWIAFYTSGNPWTVWSESLIWNGKKLLKKVGFSAYRKLSETLP